MSRWRLTIEYDGQPFVGWQRQENGLSVQAALEDAIFRFCGERACVYGAGRTDAGVHAAGQVAHVDLARPAFAETVRDALNHHLRPHPVAVLAADVVDDDFHARFSACARHYRYRILDRPARPALERGRVWWVPFPLDVDRMTAAAAVLIGKHDFTSFRSTLCGAASPVKTLASLTVRRVGADILIEARARSFLHNQVRILAGTLKRVGEGKWSTADVAAALDARDRARGGPTAPAHGLVLTAVEYRGAAACPSSETGEPARANVAFGVLGSTGGNVRQLTPDGAALAADLSARYGFSTEAVVAMMHAVSTGGGSMAQFDHPEFGGMGQWSSGGMTMIGDMFNNALKARVDALCSALSAAIGQQLFQPAPAVGRMQGQSQSQGGGPGAGVSLFVGGSRGFGGGWWPAELGQPTSTGSQNDIRYAVFPATRRLAIEIGGVLTIYDTLDHAIGGVSQQQSGDASLTFTSQRGLVRVSDLPIVSGKPASAPASDAAAPATPSAPATPPAPPAAAAPAAAPMPAPTPAAEPAASGQRRAEVGAEEVFTMLERLAALRDKGILSDEEFAAKKTELLSRL